MYRAIPRLFQVAVTALCLSGCSSDQMGGGGSDWASLTEMIKSKWAGPGAVSMQQAAANPYASIGVRIGDSSQAMLVLASSTNGDLLWVAGRRVAITTRNGRVVRTAGLAHNLAGWVASNSLSPPDPAQIHGSVRWTVDLSDPPYDSIQVNCQRSPDNFEGIILLGKTIRALKISERCEAPQIGWSFTNTYWTNPSDGFVWRSIQNIHPDLDPLDIEVLRPPAN